MNGTMRGTIATIITILVATGMVPTAADAMSAGREQSHCHVIDGNKLPSASGGEAALCAAVKRAFSSRVPGIAYHAEIRVVSASRLAGNVTVNGRRLPERKFASMDRPLAKSSFDRFAAALAQQAAELRK